METPTNNSAAEAQNNDIKTPLEKCHTGAETWLMLCTQNNNTNSDRLLQAYYLDNILRNATIADKENAYQKAFAQSRNVIEVVPPINKE